MDQSISSVPVAYGPDAARDPFRDIQTFRGLVIGIALSLILWAPLGVVAVRFL